MKMGAKHFLEKGQLLTQSQFPLKGSTLLPY